MRVTIGILLLLAACATNKPAPAPQVPTAMDEALGCKHVTAHVMALTRTSKEMTEATDEQRQRAEAVMVGVTDDYMKRCEATWTAEQRRCALAAHRFSHLQECQIETATASAASRSPIRMTTSETGLPECDEYLVLLRQLAACDKLSDEDKRARGAELTRMEADLAWLREPDAPVHAMPAVVTACQRASRKLGECPAKVTTSPQ